MQQSLGRRIMIIGPTSSGKSTLAERLGELFSFPVLHLDVIAYKKNTRWERELDSVLIAAQNDYTTRQDSWIIEGNYSVCMPQRLRLAETVIWCDPPLAGCIWRYLVRCLQGEPDRAGGLPGAKKEFNFGLLHYTIKNYPRNKRKYARWIADNPHLHVIHLTDFHAIAAFSNHLR